MRRKTGEKSRWRFTDVAAITGAHLPSASYWTAPIGDLMHAVGSGGDCITYQITPEGVDWNWTNREGGEYMSLPQ